MNERIKDLAERVGYKSTRWDTTEQFEQFLDEFAELIVRECIDILMRPEHAMNIKDLGNLGLYNEGWVRGRLLGIEHIKEHFGVEETKGWVCPKCGIDRTRESCPQGTMAAVEGRCPMIGVAQ